MATSVPPTRYGYVVKLHEAPQVIATPTGLYTTNLTREIVMPSKYTPEQRIAQFWAKVDKNGPIPEHRPDLGPCWIWTARRRGDYGQFWDGQRMVQAHVFSYALTHGPIPDGLDTCHHCDYHPCVRPDHLFAGTALDNVNDMHAKGRARKATGDQNGSRKHRERMPRGEGSPVAVLTNAMVIEIRRRLSLGETCGEIGRALGIHRSTVNGVRTGKTWRHVEMERAGGLTLPGFDQL